MNFIRNLEPSTKSIILLFANLFGGMIFVCLFNYFVWGCAYDVISSAIGLVVIGMLIVMGVGFEIFYILRWRKVSYSYTAMTIDYEPIYENFVENNESCTR